MRIITTVVFSLIAVITVVGAKFKIKKCCPEGMYLNDITGKLLCANKTDGKEDQWFPNHAVKTVGGTSRNQSFNLSLFDIEYGMPGCQTIDTHHLYMTPDLRLKDFELFFYGDSSLELNVLSPFVHHNRRRVYYFMIFHLKQLYEEGSKSNENGKLLGSNTSQLLFTTEDFCLDNLDSEYYYAVLCPCTKYTCIRKCCEYDYFRHVNSSLCVSRYEAKSSMNLSQKIPLGWRPPFNDDTMTPYFLKHSSSPANCDLKTLIRIQDAVTRCSRDTDYYNQYTIFTDGTLKIKKEKKIFQPHEYCGEVTWHESIQTFHQNLFYCPEDDKYFEIKRDLYGSLLIFGGILLLYTVLTTLFLTNVRKSLPKTIAFCHNVSLMVSYLFWGSEELYSRESNELCIFLATMIQFFTLSFFFWLNVMSLDIFFAFSSLRMNFKYQEQRNKLLFYAIYSWGLPGIITLTTLILELTDSNPETAPGFACFCLFNPGSTAIELYFYGPIGIVLLINVALFILTLIHILSAQKQAAAFLDTDESQATSQYQNNRKKRFIIFINLFLLMGLTWVTEIIAWKSGAPIYYWYATDMINILRAVFIFAIFGCKKSIFLALREKVRKAVNVSSGNSRINTPASQESTCKQRKESEETTHSANTQTNKYETANNEEFNTHL